MLTIIDNQIRHDRIRPTHTEMIDPKAILSYLLSSGFRPTVANAIIAGALASTTETRALARQIGLIAPVEISDAKECGLLR